VRPHRADCPFFPVTPSCRPFGAVVFGSKLKIVSARLLLVLLSLFRAGMAQNNGEIRGYVMDPRDNPVDVAEVEACDEKAKKCPESATTGPDGFYQLKGLPSGQYNFKISARGFYPIEIRDVQIDGPAITVLPGIRLEAGLMAECGIDRRPDYYRLVGAGDAGAVGGVVTSEEKMPIAGATVTLYVQGSGPIASQKTKGDGAFSFRGLQPRSEEYWVAIAHDGFFPEEERHLTVLPGLEAVYAPITMESCGQDRCQPHLKTIRVLPSCA
jgi:hypothetical protein